MNDYFNQIIGILKANDYLFLVQGNGGYEVWFKHGRYITLPSRCLSRRSANSVMKAARIRHRF